MKTVTPAVVRHNLPDVEFLVRDNGHHFHVRRCPLTEASDEWGQAHPYGPVTDNEIASRRLRPCRCVYEALGLVSAPRSEIRRRT